MISYLFTYSVGFFYKVFKSEGYLAFFCHYEEKTSRAECEAACRKDRLSAGQVGRLGVTFKARRSKQMEHRLIRSDVVILNTAHHCHPELVSGSQKLRRFRNMSWIIGRSAGSTQPSRGRVSLSLHSYQNPQFGMTINKISPSPYPSPT